VRVVHFFGETPVTSIMMVIATNYFTKPKINKIWDCVKNFFEKFL